MAFLLPNMTTQLAPLPVQSFRDSNGNPLAGGLLYTYSAGTSTPLATYTDSTGATPNANPIVLNSRGEANLWLTTGQSYKLILQDSLANLIWSVDQVGNATGVVPAASGANVDITSLGNNTTTIYTTAGTATTYAITPVPAYTAYAAGMSFMVNFALASGIAPTLAISGLTTPPQLVKENADGTFSNIAAGDIPINHRSRVTLISTTQALVEKMSPFFSMVRVAVDNGFGSSSTAIRRYTTVITSQGADITYADSATAGALFTVNTSGTYSVTANATFNVASTIGVSLNAASTTAGITTLAVAQILSMNTSAAADYNTCASWTGYLAANSLIRPHGNASAQGGSNNNTSSFTISRVA